MEARTMRTLADCIHEWRRRDRDNYRTSQQPSFDTTTEDDLGWEKGNSSRDERCGENGSGQSRDNI